MGFDHCLVLRPGAAGGGDGEAATGPRNHLFEAGKQGVHMLCAHLVGLAGAADGDRDERPGEVAEGCAPGFGGLLEPPGQGEVGGAGQGQDIVGRGHGVMLGRHHEIKQGGAHPRVLALDGEGAGAGHAPQPGHDGHRETATADCELGQRTTQQAAVFRRQPAGGSAP